MSKSAVKEQISGPQICNDNNPTIVVITYNRPKSLLRLLRSLEKAHYPNNANVRLIISADGNGDIDTIRLSKKFPWQHGKKIVIEHNQNLGLREHVLQCGDLSLEYGSVILLEDDLVVSPGFYNFSQHALSYYSKDDRIAGISLYSQRFNEGAVCLFEPVNNGYSAFLSKMPSSWGQAFNSCQWGNFRKWLQRAQSCQIVTNIPKYVASWPESSWKKYFCYYMIHSDKWFVYPYVSYTSNFGEIGHHHKRKSTTTQVDLALKCNTCTFPKVEDAIKYDLFWELVSDLDGKEAGILWDVYGMKNDIEADYVLSCKVIEGYRKVQGFALDLRPIQLNYFYGIEGDGFWLQERIQRNYNYKSSKDGQNNGTKFLRKLRFSRCDWIPTSDIIVLLFNRLLRRLNDIL